MGFVWYFCLLVACSACNQGLIPRRELGFVYRQGAPEAPVQIDLFVDLFCAHSGSAFSVLRRTVDGYQERQVRLKTHLVPLPYHTFAFHASKTVHAVSTLTEDKDTYNWISAIFSSMSTLTENAHSKSQRDVMASFTDMVSTLNMNTSAFNHLCCSDTRVQLDTIVAWKYACSRGVHTVPWFMINDMTVDADSWTTQGWKKQIDALLNNQ